jgi:hypothetical protein
MTPTIILLVIVAVPIVVLMLLRINAALVFLSLCLGDVLVQFVGNSSNTLLKTFHSPEAASAVAGNNNLKLTLLIVPVVLTALFMIRTVHRGPRLVINILPAAGVGLLGVLLVVPLLPVDLSNNILTSSIWGQVQNAQDLIVGASAVVCLLVLWLQRPKTGGKHHGHKA